MEGREEEKEEEGEEEEEAEEEGRKQIHKENIKKHLPIDTGQCQTITPAIEVSEKKRQENRRNIKEEEEISLKKQEID